MLDIVVLISIKLSLSMALLHGMWYSCKGKEFQAAASKASTDTQAESARDFDN